MAGIKEDKPATSMNNALIDMLKNRYPPVNWGISIKYFYSKNLLKSGEKLSSKLQSPP